MFGSSVYVEESYGDYCSSCRVVVGKRLPLSAFRRVKTACSVTATATPTVVNQGKSGARHPVGLIISDVVIGRKIGSPGCILVLDEMLTS